MPRRLYYCDHHAIPLPPGHKFPVNKYRLIRDLLENDGFYSFEQAPFADIAAIKLVHDSQYVEAFLGGRLPESMIRRIGFPWSEGLVKRTLASAGGTLRAACDALETRWGGNLAGGTHHAFRGEGSGFCVFNDIAIAIEWLRSQRRIERAAVVDLDVHQGDGTAQIFAGDEAVLTLSMHCKVNFPFRKQTSAIDVELPEGTADVDYIAALAGVLPRVEAFRPDVVFYQSGVDALHTDTLGRLKLTLDGLRHRDRLVMTAAVSNRWPFVITMGGGYSRPIEFTAQAHAQTFRTAAELLG